MFLRQGYKKKGAPKSFTRTYSFQRAHPPGLQEDGRRYSANYVCLSGWYNRGYSSRIHQKSRGRSTGLLVEGGVMILWLWSRSSGTRRSWQSRCGGSSGSGPHGVRTQNCGSIRSALAIFASPWSSRHIHLVWLGRLSCTDRTGGMEAACLKELTEPCAFAWTNQQVVKHIR